MPEEQAKIRRPTLKLIEGTGGEAEFGLAPQRVETDWIEREPEKSLPRRPGDHLEAWKFDDGAALAPIRRAARERGLNADTAVALVVERQLILGELRAAGLNDFEGSLDRNSAAVRPTIELWAAHNAYLRHLLQGDDLERNSNAPLSSPRVALPTRLIDRLGEGLPFGEVASALIELERAIGWEVAALREGRLMGEWAYRRVLLDLVDHSKLRSSNTAH